MKNIIKSLLGLAVLFISLNGFASDLFSNDKKGIWITPKPIPQNQLVLKTGEDFTFEGDICVAKWGGESHHQKCQKVPTHKLKFKAYFPDSLHDVSDRLVITPSKDKKSWKYSLKTDALRATDLNQLTLTVGTGDKKSNDLLSVKAKLEKRIQILKGFKNKYGGKKAHIENLDYINKLVAYIEGLIFKIDTALQNNPEVLAQIRLPLQVENSRPAPFYYSSNFSGYKLTLTTPTGIPFEGEKAELQASLTNLSDKNFYFPELEDDKGKDKNDGKQSYALSIDIDGHLLASTAPFNLAFGETKTISAQTGKLNPNDINKIQATFSQDDHHKKTFGSVAYRLLVLEDNIPPVFSSLMPVANSYLKTIPEFEAIFTDNLGRIDSKSIKVYLNGSRDVTNLFSVTSSGSESSYSLIGSIPDLVEGDYELTFTGSDIAGNTANATLKGIHYDKTAPQIMMSIPDNNITNSGVFKISLNVVDPSPITSIILQNGKEVYRSGENIINFDSTLINGNNSFKITSTDAAGNIAPEKNFIIVKNTNPVANFNCVSDKPFQASCQSTSIDVDFPNDSFTEYSWVVQSQTFSSSTGKTLEHNFKSGGNFPVTLTVKDSFGGLGTVTKTIMVKENVPPVASFTCTNTGVRAIHCTSNSTDSDGGIASSTWNLDDGTNFNGTSFDHKFLDDQAHTINLIIGDDLGAKTTKAQSIQPIKNQAPTFDIAQSVTTGDAPLIVSFQAVNAQDADGRITSFVWNFSDGGSAQGENVTHTFNTIGTQSATLTATDDLGGSTTKKVSIEVLEKPMTPPKAFFRYFEFGTNVELRADITRTQFDIARAYYTIDGTTTIELTDFYKNAITRTDLKTYGPHSITLTAIDKRGQKTDFTHQIDQQYNTKLLLPYVSFRISKSNALTYFFDFNKSFSPDIFFGDIGSFVIDYGDGTTQTLQGPSFLTYATHVYPSTGTYQVTLTGTTYQGNSKTISKSITVTGSGSDPLNPVANFDYRIFTWANNVTFSSESSGSPNGQIISYEWDFGDGSTGVKGRNAHFYALPGDYLVTLTVTDIMGMKDSVTQKVTILPGGDELAVHIDCLYAPYPTQICNFTALDSSRQLVMAKIDWGDNFVQDVAAILNNARMGMKTFNHTYDVRPKFINFMVANVNGLAKLETFNLSALLPEPVASVACITNNMLVSCNALGSYALIEGQLVYEFTYGDGFVEVSYDGLSTHAYTSPGLYTVSLKLKDASNAESTASTQVMPLLPPNILPVARFNCDTSRDPLTVYCWDDGIYDQDGTIVIKKFSFDDNSSAFLNPPEPTRHQFATGGDHEITLTVIDNDGGVSTITKTFSIKINNPPIANFECNTYAPQKMNCYSTSTDPDNGDWVSTFDWDFGDGTTQSGLAGWFDHTYGTNPTYTAKLTVHDQFGASSTISKEFTMVANQAPVALIYCESVGVQTINCQSNSYDPDGAPIDISWTLDDGFVSHENSFSHSFSNGLNHSVDLVITDELGVTARAHQDIQVSLNSPSTFDIKADIQSNTLPAKVLFSISNVQDDDGTISSYQWDFGDGQTSTDSEAIHSYSVDGSYSVKARVVDSNGGISEKTLIVRTQAFKNILISNDLDSGYLPLTVHFDGSRSSDPDANIARYEWYYAEEKIGEGAQIDYELSEAGASGVQLKVTNGNGVSYFSDSNPINLVADISNCPIPPTQINPTMDSTVSYDPNTKLYTYNYTINNLTDSAIPISIMFLEISEMPTNITVPTSWINTFKTFNGNIPYLAWASVSNMVQKGTSLSGFSFTSPNPPGLVKFHAVGDTDVPQAISSSRDNEGRPYCPGFFYGTPNGFDKFVAGVVQGPIPSDTLTTGAGASTVDPTVVSVKIKKRDYLTESILGNDKFNIRRHLFSVDNIFRQSKKFAFNNFLNGFDVDQSEDAREDHQKRKPRIAPKDGGKIFISINETNSIKLSEIDYDSLSLGVGKAAPISKKIVDALDANNNRIKKLVLGFDLKEVGIRCNVDKVIFLEGKVGGKKLIVSTEITPVKCTREHLNFEQDPRKMRFK